MPDIRYDVKPIVIAFKCDLCNKGEQKIELVNNRPSYDNTMQMYQHKCTECFGLMKLPKIYPYIEYERGECLDETT